MGGDTSQWQPGNLYRDTTPIHPYNGKPGWNLNTALADEAVDYISKQTATDPKRPWYIHYAPGATHAPHHPTKEWVEKISAMHLFDDGWNAVAERIFENQKKLGVIPANAKLPPWPDFLPKWDTLSADKKKLYLRQIDVWAAYMAYTDYEIGRVVETLEKLNLFENTLIVWVCGDNGMSAEGSMNGTPNEVAYFNGVSYTVEQMLPLIPVWGTDATYNHFAVPWAFAMDTPYRWCKQVASHLGGTRSGMVMSWPNRIKDAGGIRHQFHHVIDVGPTILDAIGIPQPDMVNGIAQRPCDGVSMVYSWDKANTTTPTTRKTQYFEIFGNRAIYHDGWMANTIPAAPPWEGVNARVPTDVMNGYEWELFNLMEDPDTGQRPLEEGAGATEADAGALADRGRAQSGAAAQQLADSTFHDPTAWTGGRTHAIRLHDAHDLEPVRRRARDPQPFLSHNGRNRGSRGRRERRIGHPGRALLRLRLLSEGRQADLHDQPARRRA